MGDYILPMYPNAKKISNVKRLNCGLDAVYQSYFRIIQDTRKEDFEEYCRILEQQHYQKIFSLGVKANSISGKEDNCFSKYLSPDKSFCMYIYYIPDYGEIPKASRREVRMIVDENPDTLGRYFYEAAAGGDGKTEIYMYGLTMSDDGWDMYNEPEQAGQKRRNCGQLIIIKMPDNSLFINDGGGEEQFDDKSERAFYEFCREITKVPEGQPIVINTWFISHSHRDHYSGLPVFLEKYGDKFVLKKILFNFEDTYAAEFHTGCVPYLNKVRELYPEAQYYKPHTGEHFEIAGVDIHVLYTTEDRLDFEDGAVCSENFNDTSAVLMIHFDGKKLLLTGDLCVLDARLLAMYEPSYLQADIFQFPHHGFDGGHQVLCETVAPAYTFFTQNQKAVCGRLWENYAPVADLLGRVFFGGSETIGIAVDNNHILREIYHAEVVPAGTNAAEDKF